MERLSKPPEDIKSWMRCCSAMASCYDCPYNRNDYCVSESVLSNGLAYIEYLESRLAEKNKRIDVLREMME